MDDIHQDNAKGTTKIVRNFLILQDCDEFKALFFKDPKWVGGNMMFKYRYVIKDRNEKTVMINMTKFTNMEGIFFKMDTETYGKITETSEEYGNFTYRKDKQEKANSFETSFLLFSGNHLRRHLLIDPYLLTLERSSHKLVNRKMFRNVHIKVRPHNYNLDLNCFPYPMK